MKLKALLLLVLTALLPLAAPRTAEAHADVSFDYFYDALLPYGEWIEVDGYGFCWRPIEVDADWVPYSDGYWAFTDAGWTWVGYEEFAGIVYHYGRWILVEKAGWCWVPDYEWGPAWVSWRHSEEYVGWAPLPPRAYWQPEIGISTWADTAYGIGPGYYSFCRVRDFGAPVLRMVIVNRARNVTIIRTTVNITNITYNTYGAVPVIYNGGLSYALMSGRSERPIPALKLVRHTQFDRPDFRRGPGGFSPNARTVGNQLIVNAPIVAPPAQPAFLKDKVKHVFAADKVRDGWAGVKDTKERTELRQRFQRETKGLTPYTAPARAVAASDLKAVPAQADPTAVSPVFTGKGPRGKGERQPPVITDAPVAPVQPANPVAETTQPVRDGGRPRKAGDVSNDTVQPPDPRTTTRVERTKDGGATVPPAVTGSPLKPFISATEPEQPRKGPGLTANPPVVVPQAVEKVAPVLPPTVGAVPVEPREGRGPKPMQEGTVGGFRPREEGQPAITREGRPAKPPVVSAPEADPAAAKAQAAAAAAENAAQEQAKIRQQQMAGEKQRAAQAAATAAEQDKAGEERIARQRQAEADAAMIRQKQTEEAAGAAETKGKMQQQQQRAAQAEREKEQADQERMARQRDAEANAAAQQKQLELQRQAEAAKQGESKREQMEAQQQEQIAAQRRQAQMEQQRAAQDAAKQQAAEQARAQQMERQREAQDAAKQQAAEQARGQQMERQREAQEAAKQQAAEQARGQQMERQRETQDAANQQAAEQARAQQMERQRETQEAAKQQAAEQARAQQMERQREAQEAAKQQAAEQARAQQMERQREAQEAAKQQAAEQRRQLQVEQNRAAQEAAKQQASEQMRQQQAERQRAGQEAAQQQAEHQRRAMDAQRDNAARQQAEAQRAAQQAAQAAAQAAQATQGQGGEDPRAERGRGKKGKSD